MLFRRASLGCMKNGGLRMKTRLINFEGIHGSGKSAGAWNLYTNLNQNLVDTAVYFEYHMDSTSENPCDIRKTVVMNKENFMNILQMHTADEAMLREKVKMDNGWHCIFLPDVRESAKLHAALEPFVADNGNLSAECFMQALKSRMAAFVEHALATDKVYVFENILFQQVLNELMRTMECTEQQILAHMAELEQILMPLNPLLFYLCPDDLATQINKVAAERLSDNYELYPDWIDWMIEYVQKSAYGSLHQVSNRDDLMVYFQERAALEEKCFNQLIIPKKKIHVDRMNYNEINEAIYKTVYQLL